MKQFDYLILGSGIAGLTFALKVAPRGRVAIVTKKDRAESNTNYAQGGIASVTSKEDSFELHVRDTLAAGAGLCKESVVRTIVEEGPARIQELIELGMKFSEREAPSEDGGKELDLGREGGHSKRRILHAKDVTGREIERALLNAISKQPNIEIFENHIAIDLITSQKLGYVGENRCLGAYVFDKKAQSRLDVRRAGHAAGDGRLRQGLSLHDQSRHRHRRRRGDGVSRRRGDCEHGVCAVSSDVPLSSESKIISHQRSRARRRRHFENARRRRIHGRYHPLKSLAPRDIVARAIDSEMKKSGAEHVWLDITHKPARFIIDRFPNIYQTCLGYGIDITKEPIPVVPAAHYQCGGVVTNVDGETDIAGLYAVGEVACTGLHGANRLASNSLLEALVCAHRAAEKIISAPREKSDLKIPLWQSGNATNADELVVVSHNWDEIRRLMWDYVGIVRTGKRLQRAQSRLAHLQQEIREYYWNFIVTADLLELRNIATRGGIDRALRADAARKPRAELQPGFSRLESRMVAARQRGAEVTAKKTAALLSEDRRFFELNQLQSFSGYSPLAISWRMLSTTCGRSSR